MAGAGESCQWRASGLLVGGMPHTHTGTRTLAHTDTHTGTPTFSQLDRPLTCYAAQSPDKQFANSPPNSTHSDAASGFKLAGQPESLALLNSTTNLNFIINLDNLLAGYQFSTREERPRKDRLTQIGQCIRRVDSCVYGHYHYCAD